MDFVTIVTTILTILTAASVAATAAAIFYARKQQLTINILNENNAALQQQNDILKSQLADTITTNTKEITALKARVTTLEAIKTPPLQPLMTMVSTNHKEVMTALKGKK